MEIIRTQNVTINELNDFRIGDRIVVGKYTATCQKVTMRGAGGLVDYLAASISHGVRPVFMLAEKSN